LSGALLEALAAKASRPRGVEDHTGAEALSIVIGNVFEIV
jgi:hypothetical protein